MTRFNIFMLTSRKDLEGVDCLAERRTGCRQKGLRCLPMLDGDRCRMPAGAATHGGRDHPPRKRLCLMLAGRFTCSKCSGWPAPSDSLRMAGVHFSTQFISRRSRCTSVSPSAMSMRSFSGVTFNAHSCCQALTTSHLHRLHLQQGPMQRLVHVRLCSVQQRSTQVLMPLHILSSPCPAWRQCRSAKAYSPAVRWQRFLHVDMAAAVLAVCSSWPSLACERCRLPAGAVTHRNDCAHAPPCRHLGLLGAR